MGRQRPSRLKRVGIRTHHSPQTAGDQRHILPIGTGGGTNNKTMKPFPGQLTKYNGKYVLDHYQEEWLKRWYPTVENSRLMKASGMTHGTLHRFARQYELTKSKRGMRAIMSRHGQALKDKLEKNGYYDSLRGKAPSEACLKAYREYLKSDRYVHPLHIMKKRNPRKYAKWAKERSENRKALIRREKARLVYGLPPKSKLVRQVVLKPYTRSQTSRRYYALKHGYILMTDCYEGSGYRWKIFYDADTIRRPVFEANSIREGFTFEEYKEA